MIKHIKILGLGGLATVGYLGLMYGFMYLIDTYKEESTWVILAGVMYAIGFFIHQSLFAPIAK